VQIVYRGQIKSINFEVLKEESIKSLGLYARLSNIPMALAGNELHLVKVPLEYLLHELAVVVVHAVQEYGGEETPDGELPVDLEEHDAVVPLRQFGEVVQYLQAQLILAQT
jgi:hypothetical protein